MRIALTAIQIFICTSISGEVCYFFLQCTPPSSCHKTERTVLLHIIMLCAPSLLFLRKVLIYRFNLFHCLLARASVHCRDE